MKKYKTENLIILFVYSYSADINKLQLVSCKLTTKRHLGNRTIPGSSTYEERIKTIDGMIYPTYFNRFNAMCKCVLDACSFMSIIKKDKVLAYPKKITYNEIILLEHQLDLVFVNKNESESLGNDDDDFDIKDLF